MPVKFNKPPAATGQLDMAAPETGKGADRSNLVSPMMPFGTPIEVQEVRPETPSAEVEVQLTSGTDTKGLPAVIDRARVKIAPFTPSGAMALMDFGSDPFALLDFNGANNALGQTLPMRRIEYCASKGTEALRKGLITDMATMEQKATVRAVWVAMKYTRAWMPEYDPTSESNEPLCASLDGSRRTQGTDRRVPEDQLCIQCPHAKWSPGAKHPDCSEVYTLLLLDVDDADTPFLFNIRRTGIKPFRVFRNAYMAKALHVWNEASKLPGNLCAEFTLGTAAEKNYYLPAFTDVRSTSLERARELAVKLAPILQTFNKAETTEAMLAADDDYADVVPANVVRGAASSAPIDDSYQPPQEEFSRPSESGPAAKPGAQPARKFGSR